ncbi:MAG: transposase [Bacillus sp. (in: Bacteria)]|nr:transposase [Bacillus sp. (in: firmicutes)]
MGRKAKYTIEQKIAACEAYLSGKSSAKELARSLGLGKGGDNGIHEWSRMYKEYGSEVFYPKEHNQSYTEEFKKVVVKEYLDGLGSLRDLQVKHKIPQHSTIRKWVIKYTKGEEIRDYLPTPEVYKMKARRDTTLEERIEIVTYCLEHNHNYKETAVLYNCNYSQVRNWVLKYEKNGEDGLKDKRGKRKQDEELTDLEKAERRIKQLEREKEELARRVELLKKAEEYERRR